MSPVLTALRRLTSPAALLGALLLALVALAGASAAAPGADAPLRLDRALSVAAEGDRFPADATPLREVTLPDTASVLAAKATGPVWYRLRFELPRNAGSAPQALYVDRACSALHIHLNGEPLLVESAGGTRCRAPLLLPVPASLLRAGATNTLDIRASGLPLAQAADRERALGLPALLLGARDPLEAMARAALAVHAGLPRAVALALALLGVVMLGVAARPGGWRSELRWFGLLALAWSALAALVWLREGAMPLEQVEWLAFALAPVVAACGVLFLMRHAGLRARAIDAALWAQCVVVPASLALAGTQRLNVLALNWDMLLALEVAIAAAVALERARRMRPRGEFGWLAATFGAMALALAAGVAQRAGWIAADDPWPRLLLPLAFIALGLRLVAGELGALRSADVNARALIDRRVGEAAAEAERTYAQLAELRIEQVIERERKRIAADLHDDLGAKLLTIVHTSESESISTLAREALEEMRLSVRGLTGKPVRLVDALGDWRAEFVSRLGQANIGAQWQNPSEEPQQTLPARAYVQTTRILREAVSNIIKHSGAARCIVTGRVQDGDFVLTIQDNGNGISMDLDGKLDRGHGMASMKARAKQLQGQCLVESGPGFGTVIRLTIPL